MESWDRRPTETGGAFHAFEHYRDLPASHRSIVAAYNEHLLDCLRRQEGAKRASGRWTKWSVDGAWVDRVAAHDVDLGARRRERRAAELERTEDYIVELAGRALARIEERLKEMDPDEIPAAVMDRWLKTLMEVQFRALGNREPVIVEHSGKDGAPIEVIASDMRAKILTMADQLQTDVSSPNHDEC